MMWTEESSNTEHDFLIEYEGNTHDRVALLNPSVLRLQVYSSL